MHVSSRTAALVAALHLVVAPRIGLAADASSADSLDEIVVTATLRPTPVSELPQSVTVLDAGTLKGAGVQHLEDVLGLVPNLNWASGTSRPRYFQLRGIGEVEQYQGAPNPSVGFLIDGIDFSGVGMPATLIDLGQVEVLRGPQGTAYGASALAGLINVRTADPGRGFELHGELSGGDYDTRAAGLVVGDGRDSGELGWRLVAQQYRSDGYRHDAFFDRNTTNGYDEGTLRGKLHWQVNERLSADLTLMRVNIDNGYDAWSIDNTFTTYSNQPGRDAQGSNGAALRLELALPGLGELRSLSSAADSRILYSFDGDWGNDALWGPYAPYDYFQSDNRTRRTLAQDLRLIGDPSKALFGHLRWLAGVYALRLSESDYQQFDFYIDPEQGPGSSRLDSSYAATNLAVYGSLEADIGPRTTLSGGLRFERRVARYSDSADAATPFPDQTDSMYGGNLSWTHRLDDARHLYVTASRGYKGGGFNIGSQILSEQRSFGPESLWSIESGFRYARIGGALELQADGFYMRRQHLQVYLSEQLDPSNPLAYAFFTQNASEGENFGLESEAHYRLSDHWQLSGTLALLRTRYLGVTEGFEQLLLANGSSRIDGRAQPFAPAYQVSAALEYRHPSGWFARLDANALDSFYFYTSDPQASKAYHLENLRIGFRRGAWTASAWIRNLFNVRYAQQGFYFGLIPPDFPVQSFLDQGDPRRVGITLAYDLPNAH